MKNRQNKKILFGLCSLSLAAAITFGGASFSASAYEAPKPTFGNYYTADYESKEEAMKAADAINERICEEGFTLLKNADNALPLKKGAKISVFGKSSASLLYGLSSNYVDGNRAPGYPMVTLSEALTESGFALNPSLVNFYNDSSKSGSGRGAQPTNGNTVKGFNTGETPVEKYTSDIEESYKDYSDAALVVFSRSSGEGWDMPQTMMKNNGEIINGARAKDDHYLQLDKNESDLLKYLSGRFEKVVIVLNVPSQFEVGFLDDPGHYGFGENLKACIWTGYPGRSGIKALGRILAGDINPSGKTVDTWARDFKADPTWDNFGQYGNFRQSNIGSVSGYVGNIAYKEGIYSGYRYYETRGYEEGGDKYVADGAENAVIHGTTTKEWENWYKAHVVYPFGHGLSYTTFSQEIVSLSKPENSVITADDKVEISVKVTNTGTVAGKQTVLLFYTAPYTKGGIEKSYSNLLAFDKTNILEPGESETVVLTVKARDMASYDYSDANGNGFKGYELEKGTYVLRLGEDIHNDIATVEYTVAEDIQIKTDDATGVEIVNRFDDVSNYLTDPAPEGLGQKYLSRADFKGTFPTKQGTVTASAAFIKSAQLWRPGNQPDYTKEEYYVPEENMPTFGNDSGDVKLSALVGADYDDPLWDTFMNQLSKDTLVYLVTQGGYRSGKDIPALDMTRVINAGQPAGYMSLFDGMQGAVYAFFSSDVVTASSYNEDLAYEKGIAIGNEALFGTGRGKSRFPGWYAPSADTHRSPFGGRNADYFSEDGLLAGKLAAKIISGAMEKGVFCFFKHFAVNDQEHARIGLMTWASEQAMREIYLKPFEVAVKEGKTRAIMSSLNRIGTTWTGGSRALLTNVLRKEWGFKGMVVTDSYIGNFSYLDQMVIAGGSISLGNANSEKSKCDNATVMTAVKTAAKDILYTMANSMAMNTGYATPPEVFNEWNGVTLAIATLDNEYAASVGGVTFNPDAFEGTTVPDNSEIVYTLKEGSSLPKGLTMDEHGNITGVCAEEVSSYKFTVVATYQNTIKEATFIITVANINGSIVYVGDENNISLKHGESVEKSLATAKIVKPGATEEEIKNFPPIKYSLKNGSILPDGLTLSSDGVLKGTPTKTCKDYKITVEASALGFKTISADFTLDVLYSLSFDGGKLLDGKMGKTYFDKVRFATGADEVITYSLKSGSSLPAGLTLTEGGYIVGTPRECVTDYSFTVVSSSAFTTDKEAEYSITIGINYNAVELPVADEGVRFESSLASAQGNGSVKYLLKSGKLPEGLTISEDGELTGTPTESGEFEFVVEAREDGVKGDEITVKLYVNGSGKTQKSGCAAKVNPGVIALPSLIALCFIALTKKKYNLK